MSTVWSDLMQSLGSATCLVYSRPWQYLRGFCQYLLGFCLREGNTSDRYIHIDVASLVAESELHYVILQIL